MTALTKEPITLADVLAYRNPAVVRRYAKDHQTSIAEAEEVFGETVKWLYLCYRSTFDEKGDGCAMTPELERIDWMWHTFLLFTRDYADFCERYFGVFLHHVPAEDEDDDAAPPNPADVRNRVERQFGLVYDVLGEATLQAWY